MTTVLALEHGHDRALGGRRAPRAEGEKVFALAGGHLRLLLGCERGCPHLPQAGMANVELSRA